MASPAAVGDRGANKRRRVVVHDASSLGFVFASAEAATAAINHRGNNIVGTTKEGGNRLFFLADVHVYDTGEGAFIVSSDGKVYNPVNIALARDELMTRVNEGDPLPIGTKVLEVGGVDADVWAKLFIITKHIKTKDAGTQTTHVIRFKTSDGSEFEFGRKGRIFKNEGRASDVHLYYAKIDHDGLRFDYSSIVADKVK